MRAAIPALLVLALLPPASAACVQLGCAQAYDDDRDGRPDRAGAALVLPLETADATLGVDAQGFAASGNAGAPEGVEPAVFASVLVAASASGGDGGLGPGFAFAQAGLHALDEETGDVEDHAVLTLWLP